MDGVHLDTYTIKVGDVLTMSYGSVSKTLTVTDLTVTHVDPQTDTVSGTGVPGTQIQVWVDNSDPWVER